MSNDSQVTQPQWKSALDLISIILLLGPALTYLFMIVGEAYTQGFASVYRVSPLVLIPWSTQSLIFFGFFSSGTTALYLLVPILAFLLLIALLLLGSAFAEPRLKRWWATRSTKPKTGDNIGVPTEDRAVEKTEDNPAQKVENNAIEKTENNSAQKIEASRERLLQAERVSSIGLWLAVLAFGFTGLFLIAQISMQQAGMLGQREGRDAIQTRPQPVDLISVQPLPSLEGNLVSVGDRAYYTKRVYFIGESEGFYYVFETLDLQSCSPEVVTIVPVDQVINLKVYLPQELGVTCPQ